MSVVLPGRFANRDTRPTKRALSNYEKNTIHNRDGRALVLPAEPNTEVEELVNVGFNPCFIFGVEHDRALYRSLANHYRDSAHIFNDDVFNWMREAHGRGCYSYIHMDMCGHFNREIAANIQHATRLLAPYARIRMSTFRGRRSPLQFDFEKLLHEEILLRWCKLGFDMDTSNPDRWIEFYNTTLLNFDDTTRIIVGIWTLNVFFGVPDWRAYVDDCRENGDFLPTVEGAHRLVDIQRWSYNEPGSNNHMFTVWADIEPLPKDPMRTSTQWILNNLAEVFQSLNYQTPSFTMT